MANKSYNIRAEYWQLVKTCYLCKSRITNFNDPIDSDISVNVTREDDGNLIKAVFTKEGNFKDVTFLSIVGVIDSDLMVFYADVDIRIENAEVTNITFTFTKTEEVSDYKYDIGYNIEYDNHTHSYISDYYSNPRFNLSKNKSIDDYGKLFNLGSKLKVDTPSNLQDNELYVYGRLGSSNVTLINIDEITGIYNVNYKFEEYPSQAKLVSQFTKASYRGDVAVIDGKLYIDGEISNEIPNLVTLVTEDILVVGTKDIGYNLVYLEDPNRVIDSVNVVIYRSAFKLVNNELVLIL